MQEKAYSKYFRYVIIVSLIIFMSSGLVLGNQMQELNLLGRPAGFNWFLALGCWITGIGVALIFFAIYVHLRNQEAIIDKMENLLTLYRRVNEEKVYNK